MLIIGNPENRRVNFFQQALHTMGQAPARVISWLDILRDPARLDALENEQLIRIESPGENFQVEKLILQLGGLESAHNLIDEKGRIYYPGIWFEGFKKLLGQIEQYAGNAIWFNHPDDIATMFDKPKTKRLNPNHSLPACPGFTSYEEFIGFVQSQACPRFFIKLNYSSSASGVLAFEYHPKTGRAQAKTTIELVRQQNGNCFYNSLQLKKYTTIDDLKTIIEFLFSQGAFVEPWIPKAQYDNGVFDLRVLAINGKRHHCIARISKTPITNLHLGNQRCLIEDLHLSSSQWEKIDRLVNDVMENFPDSLYAGLDVLIPQNENSNPVLLEANAFGDLLPGLLHHDHNTYQAELIALFQKEPQLMRKAA